MQNIHPLKKIAFTLLLVVLLPALFYTAYEFNALSHREKLISEIYHQQLEAILFSVNQYSWDVANSWVSNINILYSENRKSLPENIFSDFLTKNGAIRSIFLMDSTLHQMQSIPSAQQPSRFKKIAVDFRTLIQSQPDILQRLSRYQEAGYRKIEPIMLPGSEETDEEPVMLFFVLSDPRKERRYQFGGILLDPQTFISEVLLPKLKEIAGDRFYLAVFHNNHPQPLYPNNSTASANFTRKKAIWLFPHFTLGIRLRGETIEELARKRFYRNLFLILLLDIVLIAGVWLVYRNIRREMELAQMKSDFVSNISHELRTPLSLIRMFSETLEMERISSEKKKKEYYRIINAETERLTHLVNNILNFSRIEAGKKEYHMQAVNLNTVVKKVLDSYQFHLNNQGFTVECHLSQNLPVVRADEEAICEALINLLDNAIKYSDKQKYISIKTGIEDGAVFLEVEDRGIGIAPEELPKIMEKFYRVSDGLVPNTRGSGLGLSLVKHIMEAHGGKTNVTSRRGRGSRFRLIFPCGSLAD